MARVPFGQSRKLSIRSRRADEKDQSQDAWTENHNCPSEKEKRLTARFGFAKAPEQSLDSNPDDDVDYDQEANASDDASSTMAPTTNKQAWKALVAGNDIPTPHHHSRHSSSSSKRRSLITLANKHRGLCEMMCEAASTGDVPQIGRLLGAGADPKKKSREGLLPVHLAAVGGHLGVLKSLAMHGAKMDATDEQGRTALHAAILGRQTTVIPFLVHSGVPVDAKDSNGCTALHLAAQMEAEEGPVGLGLDFETIQNNRVRFSYVFGASKAARRASICSVSSTSHTPLEALLRAGANAGNVRVGSRL
jgi:hypothetical protein